MEIATIEDFDRLEKKVSQTQTLLYDLISLIGEPVLTIADIAKREGVSNSTIYREPWRLPNYGQSDFSTGRRRWKLRTYVQWIEKDDQTRERDWYNMRPQDREKLMMQN